MTTVAIANLAAITVHREATTTPLANTVRRAATIARLGEATALLEVTAAADIALPVAAVAAGTMAVVAVAPAAAAVAVAVIPEADADTARSKSLERNSVSRSVLYKQEAKHMSSMRVAAWFTWFAAWNWLVQTAMISRERFAKGVIRP
jgi:hypothetical protein